MTSSIISYWASRGVTVGLRGASDTSPSTDTPPTSKASLKPRRRVPVADRFRKYYVEGKVDECWPWMGATRGFGYGFLGLGGKGGGYIAAHRLSYQLAKGEIPRKKCVCHTCDNPRCVNPAHLWLGTYSDNQKDAYRKGRKIAPMTILKGRI